MRRPFISRKVPMKNGGIKLVPPAGGYGPWAIQTLPCERVLSIPLRMTRTQIQAQNEWVGKRSARLRYAADWRDGVFVAPKWLGRHLRAKFPQ